MLDLRNKIINTHIRRLYCDRDRDRDRDLRALLVLITEDAAKLDFRLDSSSLLCNAGAIVVP